MIPVTACSRRIIRTLRFEYASDCPSQHKPNQWEVLLLILTGGLTREFSDSDLNNLFDACRPAERVLFSTLLFSGFREHEVVRTFVGQSSTSNLHAIQVTSKPDLGFWPIAAGARSTGSEAPCQIA